MSPVAQAVMTLLALHAAALSSDADALFLRAHVLAAIAALPARIGSLVALRGVAALLADGIAPTCGLVSAALVELGPAARVEVLLCAPPTAPRLTDADFASYDSLGRAGDLVELLRVAGKRAAIEAVAAWTPQQRRSAAYWAEITESARALRVDVPDPPGHVAALPVAWFGCGNPECESCLTDPRSTRETDPPSAPDGEMEVWPVDPESIPEIPGEPDLTFEEPASAPIPLRCVKGRMLDVMA